MEEADPTCVAHADPKLTQAYRDYFTSGHYDRRYPRPNLSTWGRLMRLLPDPAAVLDFGCGSGRYLLALHGLVSRGAGFDVSDAALSLLREKAGAIGWRDLAILGPSSADLSEHVRANGQFDVVLCLFGVLAHIEAAKLRQIALAQMYAALKPGSGRLLISVPNRARRFYREQRAAGPEADGLIRYERQIGDTHLTLPYQLYDVERLQRELENAGFSVCSIGAESVLPESWLLNHSALRWLDRILTPICPAGLGYGIIAEARI